MGGGDLLAQGNDVAASSEAAWADSRVALVIGNGDYLNGPLKNTVNDARSMARALRNAGFEVMLYEDMSNKDEMKRAIRAFGMKLKQGGTALFYFAGHGMQVDGFNYLVPVNAQINIEEEIEYECLDVGFALAYMESVRTGVNIVILDACRNNPFARSFRDSKQGLVGMTAPTGTIIAFATAPGSVASDGDGVNGLYTQELLKQINMPGVQVEDVFKNVRKNVVTLSEGRQTPWESSSLIGDFYFKGGRESELSDGASDGFTQLVNESLDEEGAEWQEFKEEENLSKGDLKEAELSLEAQRTSYATVPFRWKGLLDGSYYIEVNGVEISAETKYKLVNEDLYVYHDANKQVFVLKSFIYRLDGRWHKVR
jgi:hypothetical protein